jgi:hypothetical protein
MTDQPTAQRFVDYHIRNPSIYFALRRMSVDLVLRGRKHYGMKSLFEVLRYERARLTDEDEEFKINNAYSSYYARLLMFNVPKLEGFFGVRRMTERFDPGEWHELRRLHGHENPETWGRLINIL